MIVTGYSGEWGWLLASAMGAAQVRSQADSGGRTREGGER
jgi:hypothetical protein